MNYKSVQISEVFPWDKNPRGFKQAEFDRLKRQIQELGVFKPLLCFEEGGKYFVLGGNLRLRAYRELGLAEVDLVIVDPKTEAEKIKYNLADNDRSGFYEKEKLAELIFPHMEKIQLSDYKIDLEPPFDLKIVIDTFSPGTPISFKEIADKIKTETEYQDEGPDPDLIIQSISAIVRTLAKETPEALRKAFLLITPIGRGRTFLLLADPSTEDAALEIKRLAQAGERSPLEAFLQGALPLDVPVETEGPKPE